MAKGKIEPQMETITCHKPDLSISIQSVTYNKDKKQETYFDKYKRDSLKGGSRRG